MRSFRWLSAEYDEVKLLMNKTFNETAKQRQAKI